MCATNIFQAHFQKQYTFKFEHSMRPLGYAARGPTCAAIHMPHRSMYTPRHTMKMPLDFHRHKTAPFQAYLVECLRFFLKKSSYKWISYPVNFTNAIRLQNKEK